MLNTMRGHERFLTEDGGGVGSREDPIFIFEKKVGARMQDRRQVGRDLLTHTHKHREFKIHVYFSFNVLLVCIFRTPL